jgi:hypothetical protein
MVPVADRAGDEEDPLARILGDPGEPVDLGELTREEPHWFNIPNLLTFLRALLVPVILWLLAIDDEVGPGQGLMSGETARWWAFGIFVFAAATDSVDGWVADGGTA